MSPGSPPSSSAFSWQPPLIERLQEMLPQYEIIGLVGHGGMGAVYKARQKSLKRLVAIKVLPPEIADDELNFVQRFKNEAQVMAALDHPAIVGVHDFGETAEGQLYFVMDFVDGTDISNLIRDRGPLPQAEALSIACRVCEALHYAHTHGVIHRDIKPANVLIGREGQIKVADFGLAKVGEHSMDSGLTRTNMAMGTQEFAAPEMLKPGAAVDHRADIYSLGVMLYQMLTGEVPRVMFKLPSRCRPELGTRFDALICKALETDPAERFQSAAEMKRELDAVAGETKYNNFSVSPASRSDEARLRCACRGHRCGGRWMVFLRTRTRTCAGGIIRQDSLSARAFAQRMDQAAGQSGSVSPLRHQEPGVEGWMDDRHGGTPLSRPAGRRKGQGARHGLPGHGPPPANEWPIAAVLHAGADPQYFLDLHHDRLTLRRVKQVAASSKPDYTELGNVPLDLRQAKDGAFQLEASIQGDLITIMADGAKIMEVRDEGAARAGDIALVAPSEAKGSGQIKDLAFRLLDESAVATEGHGRTIDLLSLVDVQRDTITGSWKIENGALATNKTAGQNFIRLPATPGAQYDLHLRLRREETSGTTTAVHFALTHAGHGANLIIDGVPNPRIGLEHVGGKSLSANGTSILRPSPFFASGLDHDVVIQVRDSGIVAVVDLEEAFRWSGPWSELSQQGDWFSHVQDKKPVLGIGAVGVPVVIHSLDIREVAQ